MVTAPGAFAMPDRTGISDFAESAHFLLETVGEDVIRTIPRFFYKYRGVEKIAEGQKRPIASFCWPSDSRALAAFAHALAFCQAVEAICGIVPPPRAPRFVQSLPNWNGCAIMLRRSPASATPQRSPSRPVKQRSSKNLLRLSCEVAQHRYLFGLGQTLAACRATFPDDMC